MVARPGASWWGSFELPLGSWSQWRIGTLSLWVSRLPHEWRLAWQEEPLDDTDMEVDYTTGGDDPPESAPLQRQLFDQTDLQLQLLPATADRPVVFRPVTPFSLAAGQSVELYLSMPLWLQLRNGEKGGALLLDTPMQRPSDTWFGASPRSGEICYASRTSARLDSEALHHRPHRAITPLRIINRGEAPFPVERIKLPVPLLPLLADEAGHLWTPVVTMTREADSASATVTIGDHEETAAGMVTVTPARKGVESDNLFTSMASALLG